MKLLRLVLFLAAVLAAFVPGLLPVPAQVPPSPDPSATAMPLDSASPVPSAEPGSADITIAPIQVYIEDGDTSATLNVKNEGSEPLRIQLSGSAWDQLPNGDMRLNASDDLIFFPTLATVAPHDSQDIRIGVQGGAITKERTFRIFVEELPSANTQAPNQAIAIRTRVGIPIFVEPSNEVHKLDISDAEASPGRLSFSLLNNGTIHELVKTVDITGYTAAGVVSFKQSLQAWYVLAGGKLDMVAEVPKNLCHQIVKLDITAQTDLGPIPHTNVPMTGSCR